MNLRDNSRLRRLMLITTLLIGGLLLFVGGPDYYSHRLLRASWDMGHILFMFVLGIALIDWGAKFDHWCIYRRLLAYGLIILLVAVVTEYLQQWVGRTPSLTDIKADLLGGLLALSVQSRTVIPLGNAVRGALAVIVLLLSANVLLVPIKATYDEVLAYAQFPMLSGFENRTEVSRWGGQGLKRSDRRSTGGQYSLALFISSEGYSGVAFNHFPRDWSAYKRLKFDVWSPRDNLSVTIRIHDAKHVLGDQSYDDRFNRQIGLRQGWNQLSIELAEVLSSPVSRLFELDDVKGVGLFSYEQGAEATLYIDSMFLE